MAPGGRDSTITQAVWNYMAAAYPHQANFSHCSLKAKTSLSAVHHQLVMYVAQQGGGSASRWSAPELLA